MKRLFAMLLAVAMCAGLICAPASAATVEEPMEPTMAVPVLMEPGDDQAILYVSQPNPNSVINLSAGSDECEIKNIAPNRDISTDSSYLTSTGRIRLTFDIEHSGPGGSSNARSINVSLYRYVTWYDDGWNPHLDTRLVSSRTLSYSAAGPMSRTMTFTGLDANTRYFFVFENTSTVAGGTVYAMVTIAQG